MKYAYFNALPGVIILTDEFHTDNQLQSDNTLYKLIWIVEGTIKITIDHIDRNLKKEEVLSLNPLHLLEIKEIKGKYIMLLFNSAFYGIYRHYEEVSCNGLLFSISPHIIEIQASLPVSRQLHEIIKKMTYEYVLNDHLEGEVLRLLLKYFIIICTRLAKEKLAQASDQKDNPDIVHQYYMLVDHLFMEKKQVQDYADILHRSPKTLSNLFAKYQLPSPQQIIQERLVTEAKRLLLNSKETVKEIAAILGYESVYSFSRFFKRMTGESISDFRKKNSPL